MAEDNDPSYHHDLGNLSNLEDALNGLSHEANNSDSEGSANAGSSSASQKAVKRSKKRMSEAEKKRQEALITRPSSLGQITAPRFVGETIEATLNNGVAEPTGEISDARPQRQGYQRSRAQGQPQGVLNPGRRPAGILGTSNVPAVINSNQEAIPGTGGSLDFLKTAAGGPGRAPQDLGKARPVPGANDNNTDLGKHLVQIWEHIRDTLDDIKDLLKEASGGHGGEKGGVARDVKGAARDVKGAEGEDSGSFLDNLLKAIIPGLLIFGALLVNKFGPVVASMISTAKKFADGLVDAGKNLEQKFKDGGEAIKNFAKDAETFMKNLKIPNPVSKASEAVKNALTEAKNVAPKTMAIAEGAGHMAAAIAGNAFKASVNVSKAVLKPAMQIAGGAASKILKPLGAGVGAMVGYETLTHAAGAWNDFHSGNKVGALTNTMRAFADIEEAGGLKNTAGMLADAAGFFHMSPVEHMLNKYAKSSGGKVLNKVLSFGIKQVRSRVMGAAGGVALGGAAGGGWEDVPADIVGGVVGLVAPQLIGHELRRSANFIDNKWNKKYKPSKAEMNDEFIPQARTGNAIVDKFLVDPTNAVGNTVNKVLKPLDNTTDKVLKPVTDALPPEDISILQVLTQMLANMNKNHTTAKTDVGVPGNVTGGAAGPQNIAYNFNFYNSNIQSDEHAKKIVEQAFKAKAAQGALAARANERFSNLGLPPQTQPVPNLGIG
jgi:hypothetical protein